MNVFVVIRVGVYFQNFGGIITNKDLAIAIAKHNAYYDIDDYHTHEVYQFELDKIMKSYREEPIFSTRKSLEVGV